MCSDSLTMTAERCIAYLSTCKWGRLQYIIHKQVSVDPGRRCPVKQQIRSFQRFCLYHTDVLLPAERRLPSPTRKVLTHNEGRSLPLICTLVDALDARDELKIAVDLTPAFAENISVKGSSNYRLLPPIARGHKAKTFFLVVLPKHEQEATEEPHRVLDGRCRLSRSGSTALEFVLLGTRVARRPDDGLGLCSLPVTSRLFHGTNGHNNRDLGLTSKILAHSHVSHNQDLCSSLSSGDRGVSFEVILVLSSFDSNSVGLRIFFGYRSKPLVVLPRDSNTKVGPLQKTPLCVRLNEHSKRTKSGVTEMVSGYKSVLIAPPLVRDLFFRNAEDQAFIQVFTKSPERRRRIVRASSSYTPLRAPSRAARIRERLYQQLVPFYFDCNLRRAGSMRKPNCRRSVAFSMIRCTSSVVAIFAFDDLASRLPALSAIVGARAPAYHCSTNKKTIFIAPYKRPRRAHRAPWETLNRGMGIEQDMQGWLFIHIYHCSTAGDKEFHGGGQPTRTYPAPRNGLNDLRKSEPTTMSAIVRETTGCTCSRKQGRVDRRLEPGLEGQLVVLNAEAFK
ncbi:hypothetical protein BIW11_02593 [Tropilaelaps mercedesae]|uniref:Uncharacterized protein n=1 Tax=Tropilaelaps mercedesae TaxID=418985 RepID=A0A1V9Y0H8_9ACAR|nr:hypothetical protein BIW11_02593 [Tropilaelaps mercedesae]